MPTTPTPRRCAVPHCPEQPQRELDVFCRTHWLRLSKTRRKYLALSAYHDGRTSPAFLNLVAKAIGRLAENAAA